MVLDDVEQGRGFLAAHEVKGHAQDLLEPHVGVQQASERNTFNRKVNVEGTLRAGLVTAEEQHPPCPVRTEALDGGLDRGVGEFHRGAGESLTYSCQFVQWSE